MRRLLWVAALLVAGFSRAAGSPAGDSRAPAQLLQRATRANDQYDFPQAMELSRQALQLGRANPELTLQLHFLLAQAAAAAGFEDAAVESFARALELRPTLELSPKVSPRITGPLKTARARHPVARLRAKVSSLSSPGAGGGVRTQVAVEDDLERLVEGGRLYLATPSGGFRAVALAWTEGLTAEWPCAQASCAYYVALVDTYGNEVLWSGSPGEPLHFSSGTVAAPAPPVVSTAPVSSEALRVEQRAPAVTQDRGLKRAWPWLAAGVVAAGVGAYFTARTVQEDRELKDRLANKTQYTYPDTKGLDAERPRDEWVSVGCYAGAVGFGVVTALRW